MTVRVAFPFVGDTIGGSHVSAAILMKELPAHGFAPVAIVHADGPLASWLGEIGLELIRADLPYLAGGAGGASAVLKIALIAPYLAGFLRRRGFSIVHANDGRMIASWMPAARLAGVAAVAHRRTRWSSSRLAHLTLRLAHKIIAISNYVRDGLPHDLQRRTVIITNPFEGETQARATARTVVRQLLKSERDGPVIVFVGTLQEQKRPLIYLQAAQMIQRRRADARFLLIGRDGEQGAAARMLTKELQLSDSVIFAGFRKDVPLLLAGCDVLLAPAIDEGHGRALIEAMLSNIPVVAAASGGHLEAIIQDKTGILVPTDNPQALSDAALDLLDHPAKSQALMFAAGEWARQTFSPASHAEAIASLYRDLL